MTGLHRHRKKRPVTTTSYMSMLRRMVNAGAPRIGQDPGEGLAAAWELEDAVTDMVNIGIYLANASGQSYNQLASMAGVSKAAIIKRAKLGETAYKDQQRRQRTASLRAARPRELPSSN